MQRALSASPFALQRAVRAYIANALACADKAGVDELGLPNRRSDCHKIQAGPIDEVVVQMIDGLRIARADGDALQPTIDRRETARIALPEIGRHALDHHCEVGAGPRTFVVALITGYRAHQCVRLRPALKQIHRAGPIAAISGLIELGDEVAHRLHRFRVAGRIVIEAGRVDGLQRRRHLARCGGWNGAQQQACLE